MQMEHLPHLYSAFSTYWAVRGQEGMDYQSHDWETTNLPQTTAAYCALIYWPTCLQMCCATVYLYVNKHACMTLSTSVLVCTKTMSASNEKNNQAEAKPRADKPNRPNIRQPYILEEKKRFVKVKVK